MSYEIFRNSLSLQLLQAIPSEYLDTVLSIVDNIASGYTITKKPTEIIVFDSVPEAVRLYIAAKAVEKLSPKSLAHYLRTLSAFFRSLAKSPDKVTANDIRVYLFQYRSARNIKDVTLENIRMVLSGFFRWCQDEEIIQHNPCARIAPIRCEQARRKAMTPLELEVIRKACRDPREKAVVDFLFATGARVSELCAVCLSDINWDDRTVLIRCGKGGKSRTVYLNAESVVSLKAYLETRDDSAPFLFVSSRGPRHGLTSRAIQKLISGIMSRASVRTHVTPHIFRHTSATVALRAGMPVEQVQRMLGHSNINTTMIYADVDDSDVRASHSKYVV